MWSVFARKADGGWEAIDALEIPTEGPFKSRDALNVAGGLPILRKHLISYLELEASSADLSRDAIEVWAKEAQQDAEDFDWAGAPKLKAIEEALAFFPDGVGPSAGSARSATLAWHDRAAVLIPIHSDCVELRVAYIPDPNDERSVERLRFRHASPEHTLETVLDWRGYFGGSSAIIDGFTMMRRSGRGYIASFVGATGFVVGTVLRRLTRPEASLSHDPTARRRLIGMEEKYQWVASSCPDLAEIDPIRHERAMVFVHGTVSCGIQGLKDLLAPAAPVNPYPIYRFEHDTFSRLDTNALDLVSLIKDRLVTGQLLLAAHSRGGLVAKLAAERLRREGYPGRVTVYTFGTPHLGTPLVAIGKKALNLLFKLGEDFATAAPLPVLSPLVKAFSYTVDVKELPPGISAMREDAEDISMLQLLVDPTDARAWGSSFNLNGQSGFGAGSEGFLLGALHGRRHDLVVPTDSALAFGVAQPDLSCSHLQYFLEPSVRVAIGEFFSSYSPTVTVAPAEPAATIPPPTPGRPGGAVIPGSLLPEPKSKPKPPKLKPL